MNKLHYEIVKLEIDKWDPMRLLAGGAPSDEYEPEIKDIVNKIYTVNNEHELALLTKYVFEKWFGDEFLYENCFIVAKNIWGKIEN
jgi:asparagine synthetase A